MILFLCNFLILAGVSLGVLAVFPAAHLGRAIAVERQLIPRYLEILGLMVWLGSTLCLLALEIHDYFLGARP